MDDEAVDGFVVSHPFHPLHGQRFVLVTRKLNWGQDRVTYYDRHGRLHSMPTSWTDLGRLDQWVSEAGLRTEFRLEELLELAALLRTLTHEQREV